MFKKFQKLYGKTISDWTLAVKGGVTFPKQMFQKCQFDWTSSELAADE